MVWLQPIRRAAMPVRQIDRFEIGDAILLAQVGGALEVLRIKRVGTRKIRSRLGWRFARPDKAVQSPDRHEIPSDGIERAAPREPPNRLEQNARAADDRPWPAENALDEASDGIGLIGQL